MADEIYSAGDLNLSIETLSESTLRSLDSVIVRLDSIQKGFSRIQQLSSTFKNKTPRGVGGTSSAKTSAITNTNIKPSNIPVFESDLTPKIDTKEITYKLGVFGSKYVSQMKYMSKSQGLVNVQFDRFGNVLSRNTTKLNRYGTVINTTYGKKSSFGSSGFLNIAKWGLVMHSARKLGNLVYGIAKNGADYTETLNLWRASMQKDLIPQATEFVNKMNEAYGVSDKTLMQAQATFKNMLGSLGQIGDETAYALSEGITQMALDYASLYNQSYDQAFNKFQAALAGQVRPIRSVAGYDITENTLFDLYQSLGGDKSMRQLSRTEKQLLSIYAIFQQMERSNAIGDLSATMGSFANQSRVAKDNMQQIASFGGALVVKMLETSGVMQTLNGVLGFFAKVLKAAAEATGAIDTYDNPYGGISDSALDASNQVDELQGKLTGFDKFRSLDEGGGANLGIDQKLIEAFKGYTSILDGAQTGAEDLIKTLSSASGLFDEDGTFNLDKWNEYLGILQAVGTALGILFGAFMITKMVTFFTTMKTLFTSNGMAVMLFVGGIYLLVSAIKKFISGDIVNGLYLLSGAILAIGVGIAIITGGASLIPILIAGIAAAVVALTALIIDNWDNITAFFSNLWTTVAGAFKTAWEAVSTWFMKLINTISNAFITFINWCVEAINWLIKPIDKLVEFFGGKGFEIPKWEAKVDWGGVGTFAQGGLPDKGSMFIAGEAGAEYVYNMPNGQSGVANVQQIAQATYSGTMRALTDWWGGSQARGDIPQLREANATGMYQAVTGVAKSYGEKWSKY